MKKTILILSLFISAASMAQKNTGDSKGIVLAKDQKIRIISTTEQETDLGMGMQMTNNAKTEHNIVVKEVQPDSFKISSSVVKMQMHTDMMGKVMDFDSDKKEDRESELGKSLSAELDKVKTMTIYRKTGKVTAEKIVEVKTDDADPMSMMTNAAGANDDALVAGAFFLVPAGKKVGDSWTDSSSVEKMKTVNSYKLLSLDKDIATVSLTSHIAGTSAMEMMGMQFDVTMDTNSTGQLTVNTKTAAVKTRTLVGDINSTVDMSGQSQVVTGKTKTTISYE
ncbi:MAG: hypothetical protein JWQ27_3019 [Ferruginibacter sp.]|nr:hypothetical protein [Ferruginibacter sp.]